MIRQLIPCKCPDYYVKCSDIVANRDTKQITSFTYSQGGIHFIFGSVSKARFPEKTEFEIVSEMDMIEYMLWVIEKDGIILGEI